AVVLTEESTTSSSRIFLKILLQDMAEELGMKALNDRLKSTEYRVAEAVKGMFPSNDAQAMRFAINYYTSIGLGAITEEMREQLKELPLLKAGDDSDSDSGSDSSSGSSSGSYSSSSSRSYSGSDSDSSSSSASYSSSSSRSRSPRRKTSMSPRNSRRSYSRSPDPGARPAPVALPAEQGDIVPSTHSEKDSAALSDSRSRSPQPNNRPEAHRPRVRSPSYSPAASPVRRSPERSPSADAAEHGVRSMDKLSLREGTSARGRSPVGEKGADSRSRSPHRRHRSPAYSRSPSPRAGYGRSRGRDEHRSTRPRYDRDRSREVILPVKVAV
ncbi:pre-mRNA-splicing factor cwc22, partial [Coemansia linderi]